MDIKLLFQILTPLSMGGSIIGLFGDFGDGWFTSGYEFESHKEAGQESGLLGHFRVGNVVRDMDYLGVERAAQFSDQAHLKKVRFQIDGFGQKVVSINGNVLTKEGQNKTVTIGEIRKLASSGGNMSGGGELNMQVKVNRVPLSSLGGRSDGSGSVAIDNDDVCTVAYNTQGTREANKYDLFYIFGTVEIKNGKVERRLKNVGKRSSRSFACSEIWAMYNGTSEVKEKGEVVKWTDEKQMIHLHQREVGGGNSSAVYLIGNQNSYYLWGQESSGTAISLEGIIWSGRAYDQRMSSGKTCNSKRVNERRDCYNDRYASRVNKSIGWEGWKGDDFEKLTIRSRPGIKGPLAVKGKGGIHHSGYCGDHKICVNYPWEGSRTLTQRLATGR